MSTTEHEPLTPDEQAILAATAERVRQLRRKAGVPDGMPAQEAIAWHMISSDDLERARWGSESDTPSRRE